MDWSFPYLGETEELNDANRGNAPGRFVQLSDGYTHYELAGPENGLPVVLVHGFSIPYFIWEPTFAFLNESGCRVLRYDLFGRGFSDRPNLRYDIDLFCKQLGELLDTLGFKNVNLMGLSMGGAIIASFTALHLEKVERLIFVDPTGAKPISLSWLHKVATLPGFGELAIGLFGSETMIKGIASDLYGPELVQEFQEKFRLQIKYKGYKRAILSTMRNEMLGEFLNAYRTIGKQGIPALLFWGRDDRTVPITHSDDIRSAIPQTEFYSFDKCGHIPHYEKANEVNQILMEFLS